MTNPGLYTPLDCIHDYVKALCGATPPVQHFAQSVEILHVAGAAAVVTVVMAVLVWVRRKDQGVNLAIVVSVGVMSLVVALAGVAVGNRPYTLHTPMSHFTAYVSKHQEEYDTDLRLWLSTDYRITVDEAQTTRLRHGDTVAVTLDGSVIPITLIDAGDNSAAVQRVGGNILAPNGATR